MGILLVLECPNCGEEKNMVEEDLEYRKKNKVGINCVHCNERSMTSEWEEIHRHD